MDTRTLAQRYDAVRVLGVQYQDRIEAAKKRLESLKANVVTAKAAIRDALDMLALKSCIPATDVNYAMDGYADNMLADAIYSVERDLEGEIEALEQEIGDE